MSANSCTTNTGQTIQFDFCVVATGQKYSVFVPNPLTERTVGERKATIANLIEQITNARTIVISGAGAVGSELASDIKIRNKEKT